MPFFRRFLKQLAKGTSYWREILSLFFICIGFYFFRRERMEIQQVSGVLSHISSWWILSGTALAILYILLQSLMYVTSFAAVGARITLAGAVEIYLKRNLIGIFLPAGGVTSQTFFKSIAEKQQISNTKINLASYIFLVLGIMSVLVVGIPVILYLVISRGVLGKEFFSLIALVLLVLMICWISWSVYHKGKVYGWLTRIAPQLELILQEMFSEKISAGLVLATLLISVAVELVGISQLYIAIRAISPEVSLQAAFVGYTIATIFLITSPFLKGIGAIEVSLVYVLTLYGYGTAAAASITLLYRFSNFWLVVLAGLVSFLVNRGNLVLRIFPAFLIFILGFVNLVSGLTPAIHWRISLIESFLPVSTIHASKDLVVVAGLVLIVTSAFLLRGLRTAWIIALAVSLISVVAHITKSVDYEEAVFAAVVVLILAATRAQYRIKSNPRLVNVGVRVALLVLVTCIAFGITGFYFLNKRQFGVNLNLFQSLKYTLQNFILLNTDLVPHTHYAREFLKLINMMGIGSLGFLFYTAIRPFVFRAEENQDELVRAKQLVKDYGSSSIDYFKTYPDKLIFFNSGQEGFISYKVAGDFAIVLGMPVCPDDDDKRKSLMTEFEIFCTEQGLKPAYYRVDEKYLSLFAGKKNHALLIGQEAIVDVPAFSLEGKQRTNLRYSRNNLQKKGYRVSIHEPPVSAALLQQLKAVSEEWLGKYDNEELGFSQGIFLEGELRQHTVMVLEAPDGRMEAFLDLIPDFKPSEVRYDLIRRLGDAPHGSMDVLIVELIQYCQNKGIRWLNLGLAPMSGIESPRDFRERSIKFAYERIKRFSHYRGLRSFKEKFDPEWENKYLLYAHHFDLLLFPPALAHVMKNT
ncbi:MAG TPA: phosphatidylglycerol lysyltransferase domain-containing protein [Chitinophagaceae bacterium]|nr:phosphatidylglycerol lysyltransferase domain-containing protein [Chitinophagaceae bacterium]